MISRRTKHMNKLKELRTKKGLTQTELGKIIGVKQNTLSYWEKGTTNIDNEILVKLANLFNVTTDTILGKETIEKEYSNIKTKKLPLLGNVACGEPIFANEEHEAFVQADEELDADFCLIAKGDSMVNARIFDGDVLFVKKQQIVNDGEIAVILIEDEATVKRVYYDRENNIITLMPENPIFKPMRYVGSELEQIKILGKVIVGQYYV